MLDGVPRHGYPVLHEGAEVGTVASGTFSPTLGHGIATAYVPVALAEPGTQLEIAIRRKTVQATVDASAVRDEDVAVRLRRRLKDHRERRSGRRRATGPGRSSHRSCTPPT